MLSSDLLDGPGLDEETSSKSSSSSSHCATRGLSTSLELDDDSSPESPDSSYSEGAIAVILSKKAAKGEDGAWTKAEALERANWDDGTRTHAGLISVIHGSTFTSRSRRFSACSQYPEPAGILNICPTPFNMVMARRERVRLTVLRSNPRRRTLMRTGSMSMMSYSTQWIR